MRGRKTGGEKSRRPVLRPWPCASTGRRERWICRGGLASLRRVLCRICQRGSSSRRCSCCCRGRPRWCFQEPLLSSMRDHPLFLDYRLYLHVSRCYIVMQPQVALFADVGCCQLQLTQCLAHARPQASLVGQPILPKSLPPGILPGWFPTAVASNPTPNRGDAPAHLPQCVKIRVPCTQGAQS